MLVAEFVHMFMIVTIRVIAFVISYVLYIGVLQCFTTWGISYYISV